jgi:hypothetical protein
MSRFKKIFSPEKTAKKFAILTQNTAILCLKSYHYIGFEIIANCSAENWAKLPKVVIITLVLEKCLVLCFIADFQNAARLNVDFKNHH